MLTIMFAPGPLTKGIIISIPNNTTGIKLASILKEKNVIENRYIFLIFAKIFNLDRSFIKGDFKIAKSKSLLGVLFYITNSSNIYYYRITLIEGYNKRQMRTLLLNDVHLSGNTIKDFKEGTILPDTYFFTRGEARDTIVLRAQKAMQELLDTLWQNRDKSLPYKNKNEALILASIVEEESTIKSERSKIAGLFLNRLRLGMKIQSDPTVSYGLGRDNADGLTKADILSSNSYNTYYVKALPIGPITNPSRASLKAVFFPSKTKYLYFVADGQGGHIFATNLQDHNKNVIKWRKIEVEIKSQKS